MPPFVEAEYVVTLTATAAGTGGKLPSVWEAYGEPAQSLDRAQLTFQDDSPADGSPAARGGDGGCERRHDALEDVPVIGLDIPVPDQLEAAVGLPDTPARWFALYWTPCGDEANYDDGRSSGTGNWTGYAAYTRHPAVCLALAPYRLGSSDAEAEHWLLVDRSERKASVGPWREVARVLREQWQESAAAGPLVLSEEEIAEVMRRLDQEFRSRPMPTMEEITARMAEQRRLEEEMVRWLDATPQAAAGREAMRRLVKGDKGAGEEKEDQP